MISDYTIVTASDNTYFHFVQGLILSIREKKEGRDVPISFLDLGCSSEQLQWLEDMRHTLRKPSGTFNSLHRIRNQITLRPRRPSLSWKVYEDQD